MPVSAMLVMAKASRNSFVMTEYYLGVSLRAVAMRPPAGEDAATKPTSESALRLNGSSRTTGDGVAAAGWWVLSGLTAGP